MTRWKLLLAVTVVGIVGAGCVTLPLAYSIPSVDLIVAATTDVHGYVRGWDYYANAPDTMRGLSRAATIIDSLRRIAATPPVVVDAGDILQGNPMAFVAARIDSTIANPIILAMNTVRYDAPSAVGNHEFNYGLAGARPRREASRLFRSSPPTSTTPTARSGFVRGPFRFGCRNQDRDRRGDNAWLDGVGPRQPRGPRDDRRRDPGRAHSRARRTRRGLVGRHRRVAFRPQ